MMREALFYDAETVPLVELSDWPGCPQSRNDCLPAYERPVSGMRHFFLRNESVTWSVDNTFSEVKAGTDSATLTATLRPLPNL